MARRAGVPLPRVLVLPRGTLLEEQLSLRIEDEEVDRPMAQVAGMDHAARLDADDRSCSLTTSKRSPLASCAAAGMDRPHDVRQAIHCEERPTPPRAPSQQTPRGAAACGQETGESPGKYSASSLRSCLRRCENPARTMASKVCTSQAGSSSGCAWRQADQRGIHLRLRQKNGHGQHRSSSTRQRRPMTTLRMP